MDLVALRAHIAQQLARVSAPPEHIVLTTWRASRPRGRWTPLHGKRGPRGEVLSQQPLCKGQIVTARYELRAVLEYLEEEL